MGTPTRRSVLSGAAAAAGLGVLARPAAADQAGRFTGKVVLITGGTSGIGEATARAFAAAGAKVAFCGRRTDRGREVERGIRATRGEATYIQADVRKPSSVQHFVGSAVQRYGRLDIAFNNAGVQISAPLHEVTLEQWDDVTNTNARGVFLTMKYQIPHMLRTGGHIIVNSSVGALIGRPNLSTYQATKQAVQALVKAAALEYGSQGIRVNAILPGITDTAMIRPPGLDDATWRRVLAYVGQENVDGLKRTATPQMIASAVLGLAGEEFAYLTGACVPVDGGIAAGRRMLTPPLP
ncbi:SDR family oxidoreductase [Kibdelosporangium philippinense]|uniref:SDR family oxidoreductase n=1 Tax=Kibdelosporangium philippinense TaxID=211113 RepID=A0ABS8ZCV9_9PSEU|nr:SDR family oxidoreductase [Kibdelosporangium philippinense]MCE7003672.1 SDR family oxidoreductase [Kibdelosporangium philippinense]